MSRFVDTPKDFVVYPPGVTPPPFTLLEEEPEDDAGQ
jgi:hypothetical protein